MKNKFKLILRLALISLAAVMIGVNVFVVNASFVGGDPLPMPFGVGLTVVLSGSMEPELSVDDLLVVVKASEYRERDVVVYRDGRSAVVHRIILIDGESVTTQGDANNAPDEPIMTEQIKGRVLFAIPGAGAVIDFIRNPICTFIILGLAIFFMERSFRKDKKSKHDDLQRLREEIEQLKNQE